MTLYIHIHIYIYIGCHLAVPGGDVAAVRPCALVHFFGVHPHPPPGLMQVAERTSHAVLFYRLGFRA